MPGRKMIPGSKVTIVGAGLSGPLLALVLARRGHEVHVFERRSDPRKGVAETGRSINLTIAERGLEALRRVGLDKDVVTKLGVPGRSRVVHDGRGGMTVMRQGRGNNEVLYAVSRSRLSAFLLDAAQQEGGIHLHFDRRLVELDRETATAVFEDTGTGSRHEIAADMVVGADGTYSKVRQLVQRGEFIDFSSHYVGWRYREVTIDAAASERGGYDPRALHVWPRGERIMFALPNQDGSFNGVCVLPATGPDSFETLHSEQDVLRLFEANFPDVLPYTPDLASAFMSRPPAGFPTVTTSSWYHGDTVVLVGDSAHTVIPFYGQGMNAAFEDCVVLDECLAEHPGDRASAFAAYQRRRKADTDALVDLSMANFNEIRETTKLPAMMLRRRLSLAANRLIDKNAMPLYAMVTYTTIPYAECARRAARQDRVARLLGVDLAVTAVMTGRRLRRAVGVSGGPPGPPGPPRR
jgi:kynurenine 3-monooxygenase